MNNLFYEKCGWIFFAVLLCLNMTADAMASDDIQNIEPQVLEGNKSVTLNGTGYVFYTLTPVTKSFLDSECIKGKGVLEIGTGFSNVPIIAFHQGVHEYVANDLSEEHLSILRNKVKESNLTPGDRLKFLTGKAPEVLEKLKGQTFDAILAEKVIHFFKPTEIEEFIEKSKALLKPGGKIYVTAASPYSRRYEKVLETYLNRKKEGEQFPGYFLDIMKRLNSSEQVDKNYKDYKVPDSMTLFSREDLVKIFHDKGFDIIKSYSLKIPSQDADEWIECKDDESNVVGIIAVNKPFSKNIK